MGGIWPCRDGQPLTAWDPLVADGRSRSRAFEQPEPNNDTEQPWPSVSVVIPTVGRASLTSAVESALEQSVPVSEVIVCLDADIDIADTLPGDSRVKLIAVGPGAGGNAARQAGIAYATSDLIALLDDDDLWRRDKLAKQLDLVRTITPTDTWLATCRLRARDGQRVEIWPDRPISHGEKLTHYIFRKHRIRGGVGFVQASTLVFPREIGMTVPFDSTLRFHQDIDWLLAIDRAIPNLSIVQAQEPLVDYFITQAGVANSIDAAESMCWATRRITDDRRSLADFLLTTSVLYATRREAPVAAAYIMLKAIKLGRPGIAAFCFATIHVALAFGKCLMKPLTARRGRSNAR